MNSSGVWNGEDPTLSVSSQDDFQQFLNMGISDTLQFDFPDFNQQHGQGTQMMHHNEGDSMDTRMDGGRSIGHEMTMQEQMPSMTASSNHSAIHTPIHAHPSSESLGELDAQIQFLQHQRHQQQQRQLQEQQRNFYAHNRIIPPTPTSMEMHAQSQQFYSQSDPQQQAMFDRYRMQKEQDVCTMNGFDGNLAN
jgi:hypothetical protein